MSAERELPSGIEHLRACLIRTALAMPLAERRAFIELWGRHHGERGRVELEADIKAASALPC